MKQQDRSADVLDMSQGRALLPLCPGLRKPADQSVLVIHLEAVGTLLDLVQVADAEE